jgi:hypothetical protein
MDAFGVGGFPEGRLRSAVKGKGESALEPEAGRRTPLPLLEINKIT